jgi:chorismate mutase-like protein
MNGARDPLSDLRREIDDIDDQLHDLLMRRGGLVARIRDAKQGDSGAVYRPGREAAVLRRLAGRHKGPLPVAVIVRLWRELISAFVGMQGHFAVALWEDGNRGCRDLARDHFGSIVPLSVHATPRGVIRAVFDGEATVGVLPLPRDDDDDPWWLALAGGGDSGVRISARLPFVAGGNSYGAADGAMVIADIDPDPSGSDLSYVAVHYAEAMSRARLGAALEEVGLTGSVIAQSTESDGGGVYYLVEIDDFVTQSDVRLARLVENAEEIDSARVVGVCATPLAGSGKAKP